MSFIAAGMESDSSDSDYDTMVFSSKESSHKKINKKFDSEFFAVPADYAASNGCFKPPPENISDVSPEVTPNHKIPSNSTCIVKKKQYCAVTPKKEPLDDLRYAIMQGNLEVTKSKIEEGIAVDCVLKSGWTGLMYACSSAHDHIVEFLLENGANPNYDKDCFTPLMAVCASTKPETTLLKCCRLLLKHKAEVNVHERHLTTPLMFAAREGHFHIVQDLVEAGAELNLQDNRGRTALMWAASNGFGPIVRHLLVKGADPNIVDSFGQTAADLATHCDYNEIATLLEKSSKSLHNIEDSKEGVDDTQIRQKKDELKLFPKNSYINGNFQSKPRCYNKQNELELFLNGLELSHLINIVKEHQISFQQFIVLSEEELEKIGIHQIGVRKKILDAAQAVHKEKWKRSSLPNMRRLPYISCPDAVAMVANIGEHLEHISSQIVYIRLQIQERPKILELAQDTANVHNLIEETENGLKNVKTLYDELRFLKLYLNRIQGHNEFEPGDLIDEKDSSAAHFSHKASFVFGIFIVSVTIGGIFWKRPESFTNVNSFIMSKIPFLK